jgi:hypothetical protein
MMSPKGKQEGQDHLVAEKEKNQGEGRFLLNVFRKGWRPSFWNSFAFKFKFLYRKRVSSFITLFLSITVPMTYHY